MNSADFLGTQLEVTRGTNGYAIGRLAAGEMFCNLDELRNEVAADPGELAPGGGCLRTKIPMLFHAYDVLRRKYANHRGD